MENIVKLKSEEIATYRAKALNELGKSYLDCVKQIKENPFIRQRWSFIDKLFFKFTVGYVPPTPAKQRIDALKIKLEQEANTIEENTQAYINVLSSYH